MFKKKTPRLIDSKLFEDERMRLGALLYAIENTIWNRDIKKLARGIDRGKLLGLPWSVSDLVGFAGGLMVPPDHPMSKSELSSLLKLAIKEMEEGEDLITEEDMLDTDGPKWID